MRTKALIALVAVLAVLVAIVFYYRAQYTSTLAEYRMLAASYSAVVTANENNVRVMEEMARTRALDDKAVQALNEAATVINEAATDLERGKSDLIQNDLTARDYFNVPVPDSIKRLYAD